MIGTERIGSEGAPSGALSPVRRLTASGALLGAAAIHAAATPDHLAEWAGAGLFLLALAAAQAVLGLALLKSSTPTLRAAALLLSAGAVFVWALSRTAGMPIGPHQGMPEPAGVADGLATLLEGLTIAVLIPATRWRGGVITRLAAMVLAAVLVGAVTAASPVVARSHDEVPSACARATSPSSYLDHSTHRDPLAFLRDGSAAAHAHCLP